MAFQYQQAFDNLGEQFPINYFPQEHEVHQTMNMMQAPSPGQMDYNMFGSPPIMDLIYSDQSTRKRSHSENFSSESSEDTELTKMIDGIDLTDPRLKVGSGDFLESMSGSSMVMNVGAMGDQQELGNTQLLPDWTTYPVDITFPCPNSIEQTYNQVPQEPERNNDSVTSHPLPIEMGQGNTEYDPKLELILGFLSAKEPLKTINHSSGFLLFHEMTPDLNQMPPTCQLICFQNVDAVLELNRKPEEKKGKKSKQSAVVTDQSSCTEKQKKYINQILSNMHGGLQVRWHDGCIYATRRSKAKIFWKSYSTDTNIAKELPRCEETMIFNLIEFKNRLLQIYIHLSRTNNHSKVVRSINPAIYFVFGQKWSPESTPVSSSLVWAKLIPCLAQNMWDSLLHPEASSSQKHKNMSHTSYNSDLLQMSEETPGDQWS